MKKLKAVYEQDKYVVYDNENIYGTVQFDYKSAAATVTVDKTQYRAEQESDGSKQKVFRQNGTTLFRFEFDYLWGGAELVAGDTDMGFEIKGRWFKPGTRLVDEADKDLVVCVSGEGLAPDVSVTVNDEATAPVLVMATLYYHIQASATNTLVAGLINNVT